MARVLKIDLQIAAVPESAPATSDANAYSTKTEGMLGKDALGEKNPTFAIDTKTFRAHADALGKEAESFLGAWAESKGKIDLARTDHDEAKETLRKQREEKSKLVTELQTFQSEVGLPLKEKRERFVTEFNAKIQSTIWEDTITSVDKLPSYRIHTGIPGVPELADKVTKLLASEKEYAANEANIKQRIAEAGKSIKEKSTSLNKAIAACANVCGPVIDAPSNNPERAEILGLLEVRQRKSFITDPPETGARDRLGSLAKVEASLNAWVNRRAEQMLPPPRDALHLAEVLQSEHRKLMEDFLKNGWKPPPIPGFDALPEPERKDMTALWDGLRKNEGVLRLMVPVDAAKLAERASVTIKQDVVLLELEKQAEAERKRIAALPSWQRPRKGSISDPEDKAGSNTASSSSKDDSEEETEETKRQRELAEERQKELDHQIRLLSLTFKAAEGTKSEDVNPKLPDADTMKAFRVNLLSDLARLMAVPSGRDILSLAVKAATDRGLRLDIVPGNIAQCGYLDGQPSGTPEDPENILGEMEPASGSSGWVSMPCGMRDADNLARTEKGTPIVVPTAIILGHELLHALHGLTGTHRGNPTEKKGEEKEKNELKRLMQKAGLGKEWTNFEEYWTIKAGEISEQTIRQDYGLSAERFGHGSPESEEALADAATKCVEDSRAVEAGGRVKIASAVAARGFTPESVARMTDTTLLGLWKADTVDGPLPAGWDPNTLDARTIGKIAKYKLPYRLRDLGWTAFRLPYDAEPEDAELRFPRTLKAITECTVDHPKSAVGRRFAALGGVPALEALERLKAGKGIDLGARSKESWPANLATLERAAEGIGNLLPAPDATDAVVPAGTSLVPKVEFILKSV